MWQFIPEVFCIVYRIHNIKPRPYEKNYGNDPYGRCTYTTLTNFVIISRLEEGETTEQIKKIVPPYFYDQVDGFSKLVAQKNVESALMLISDGFKECIHWNLFS